MMKGSLCHPEVQKVSKSSFENIARKIQINRLHKSGFDFFYITYIFGWGKSFAFLGISEIYPPKQLPSISGHILLKNDDRRLQSIEWSG